MVEVTLTKKEVFLTIKSDLPARERFMDREGRTALAKMWWDEWAKQRALFLAEETLALVKVTQLDHSVTWHPETGAPVLWLTCAFLFREGGQAIGEDEQRRQFWRLHCDMLDVLAQGGEKRGAA